MKMYNFIYPQWSWVRIPVCWGSIGYSVSGTWDWTPSSVGRIPCSLGPRPGSSARQSPPPACPHTQTSCTPAVYINTRIYRVYMILLDESFMVNTACLLTQTSCTPEVSTGISIYIWYYDMRVLWCQNTACLLTQTLCTPDSCLQGNNKL